MKPSSLKVNQFVNKCIHQQGLTYVEVLVTTVLIAVTLVPALESIQGALVGSGTNQSLTNQHYLLVSKVEELLAEPFNALEAEAAAAGSVTVPTSYSDASGTADRKLVFIFGFDGDNDDADNNSFTGVDDGLLWMRVEIEGTAQSIETVVSR